MVFIPEDELTFCFSRAGGPGGQNVNKVSTRVTLHFNVDRSPSFSEEQKERIRARLATRINKEGILRVVCQETRSQLNNRALAVSRLQELIAWALAEAAPRRPTRATKASQQRRLEEKSRHSALKRIRKEQPNED